MIDARDPWRRAWSVAEELAGLDADEQRRRIAAIEDVELREAVTTLLADEPEDDVAPLAGVAIGEYVLERRIGRGGMGEVWEARNAALDRSVAVKLLRDSFPDRDALLRFTHEARVQARFAHPDVAHVYGTGTWRSPEGRELPWIAMELIPDARTVAEHVAATPHTARSIAELVRRYAAAIGQAHEQGILHRDIKPSNLLVAAGERPVVIDFGLARLEEDEGQTATGTVVGTIDYMAPERIDPRLGLPGARSDVYSLGLVLHELLARAPRFQAPDLALDAAGLLHSRMGGGRTRLDGLGVPVELEWIVAKATGYDADRRYPNASALAEDLGRFLDGRAPLATPESSTYRLRLFLRRHRVAAAAATVVASALVVAGFLSVRGLLREARAADREVRNQRELGVAYTFVEDLLRNLSPGGSVGAVPGDDSDLLGLLRGAYERRESEVERVPWRVQMLVADLARALGDGAWAAALYQECLAVAAGELGYESSEARRVRRSLSHAFLDTERLERAEELLVELLVEDGPAMRRTLQMELGGLYVKMRRFAEAEQHLAPVLAWREEHLSPDDPSLLAVRHNWGSLLRLRGHPAEAEQVLADVLARRRRVLGSDDVDTLASASELATALDDLDRGGEAVDLLRRSLADAEELLPPDHPRLLLLLNNLGTALERLGRYNEQVAIAVRSVEIRRRVFGPDDPRLLTGLHNLACACWSVGEYARSAEIFEPLVEQRGRILGPDDFLTLTSLGMYARTLMSLRRFEDSVEMGERAYEGLRDSEQAGPLHPNTLTVLTNLAVALQDAGRPEDSERAYLQAIEGFEETFAPDHADILIARGNLATLYNDQGRHEEAAREQRRIVAALAEAGRAATPYALNSRSNLSYTLMRQGRSAEALAVLRGVLDDWPENLPRAHPVLINVFVNLTRACAENGLADEARSWGRFVLDNVTADDPLVGKVEAILVELEESVGD